MKKVLSVGQCGFDHGSITRFLQGHFDAEVSAASTADDALALLRQQTFNLILVNRQFDADGDDGLSFIQTVKSDPQFASIPVMLITNYPDYAKRALALGAVPGFGKSELTSPGLVSRLGPYLQTD